MKNYDDIINLAPPPLKNHKRMSRLSRAAQFGAFRALVGHEEAIEETARLTEKEIFLDEYEKERLNQILLGIAQKLTEGERPKAQFCYFVPDTKKQGGEYVRLSGAVQKIDTYIGLVIMEDLSQIPIKNILDIVCL